MQNIKARTDLGNAQRFEEQHRTDVRFCKDMRRPLFWNGKRWQIDDTGAIQRKAQETVRRIVEEIELVDGDALLIKELREHARRSQSYGRISALVRLAQTLAPLQVELGDLDADPLLLNCRNGTIDLRAGQLLPHSREHLITRMAPVEYDVRAQCPLWLAFLDKVLAGDDAMISYLKRLVGYTLTGYTLEQCLFILAGHGANGKSTLLETLRKMLGDYARHTPSCTLLNNNLAIRNDLARLRGARLVSAVEIGLGKKLDEALVKQLTGGDPITSRFLFQEYFEHRPTFKLFLAVNHLPEIRGMDHGIWRRIHLLPFNVAIREEEMDRELTYKLEAELPGILNWAVQGCLEWQRHGLEMPVRATAALTEYQGDSDNIADFLGDCCIVRSGARVTIKQLYDRYDAWAEENDGDSIPKKAFGKYLKQKGFKQGKNDGFRFWTGLGLKSNSQEPQEAQPSSITNEVPAQTY